MRHLPKVAALAGLVTLLSLFASAPAQAHGSMGDPISRIYGCFLEGPENPRSEACKEAIRVGDSWPIYDWDEVNLPDVDGHHREQIPDGQLCSAGRSKYKGLDLARDDWTATQLPSEGSYTFVYPLTAHHPGTFELYITNDGYDPLQPLKWSDLEDTPFFSVDNPPIVGQSYQFTAELPAGKTGRHLIYSIWQRHKPDSGEAFYACSDVTFGTE